MRVLLVNGISGWQSTGKIVSDLQKYVINNGAECAVAYAEKDSTETTGNYRIGKELNRYMHAFYTRITDKHGFSSTGPTKRFINFIESYKPDIIHLHNVHGYYVNIELLFNYFQRAHIPIVWTLHDCWSFTGHCAYFDYANCDKWITGCKNCVQLSEYPKSYVDKSDWNYHQKKELFTKLEQLYLVTPSRWLKELVKKSFLQNFPVVVINNGINTKVFKNTESDIKERYGIENRKIILGVASIWDRRKGLDYFINLAKIVDNSYKIVLLGLNDKQIKHIPNTILGIKRTRNQLELAQWYSAAHVFVNPTTEDNYPTTNLEAIACGTPVITFDTGGSGESANYYGIVLKEKSAMAIATAIYNNNFVKSREIFIDKTYSLQKYYDLYDFIYKNKLYDK